MKMMKAQRSRGAEMLGYLPGWGNLAMKPHHGFLGKVWFQQDRPGDIAQMGEHGVYIGGQQPSTELRLGQDALMYFES